MLPSRRLVPLIGVAICLSGCQTNPSHSRPAAGQADAARPPMPPLSEWKEQRTTQAMRGLRYDSGRVELDQPAASEIAPQRSREQAFAEMRRGVELAQQNYKTDALATLTKAVLLAPDEGELYLPLGWALEAKSKTNAALAAFATMLDLLPESLDARVALALTLQRSGDGLAAIDMWNSVLERRAGDAEAHRRLAILYYYQNDYAAAWLHVGAVEDLNQTVPPQFRSLLASRSPEPVR